MNDAIEESRTQQAESMRSLTTNIDIGNLGEALEKLMPK
jgi:hypothetical protein